MKDEWGMMNGEWWMMNGEWWMMNGELGMRISEWGLAGLPPAAGFGGWSGGSGFEWGGVGAAAARLALVVQMPPEENGRAVHALAAAQRDLAAAVGADGLGRGVGAGRDGLVGVGVVGGFHQVLSYELRQSYLIFGSFSCLLQGIKHASSHKTAVFVL
jgi:hypothetical protein